MNPLFALEAEVFDVVQNVRGRRAALQSVLPLRPLLSQVSRSGPALEALHRSGRPYIAASVWMIVTSM
jgi:hypothetical protein